MKVANTIQFRSDMVYVMYGYIFATSIIKLQFTRLRKIIKKISKKILTFILVFGIIILVQWLVSKIRTWLIGQVVKTPPSHGGYRGSNPL